MVRARKAKAKAKAPRTKTSDTGSTPYLHIGEVARMLQISNSTLRDWQNVGLVTPARTKGGYRLYTDDDVALLKRARHLRQKQGLNAAGILRVLASEGSANSRRANQRKFPGQLLRELRQRRDLPLAKVANAVGISVGFLSSLERGQTSATVSTMRQLAEYYGRNVLDFFNPAGANPRLVRPGDRKIMEAGPGVRIELLAWGNTVMEPHLFRIAPGCASGDSYQHAGEEFLYVMRGAFEITLRGAKPFSLGAGDALYFESSAPHRWRNPGKEEAWVLWINTPPTF